MEGKLKIKEPVFTRKALTDSKEFAAYKDILCAVLSDGEYTKGEAWKKINGYLNMTIR